MLGAIGTEQLGYYWAIGAIEMVMATDYWYVKLPDGRTVRARNAEVLRSYLRAGRIPWESRVRRTGEDEWHPLEQVAEFAQDAGDQPHPQEPGASPVTRIRPAAGDLRTIGLRGLVDELFNAFDSSITRSKLTIAAFTSVLLALGVIAVELVGGFPLASWSAGAYLATTIVSLVLVALATTLLTKMTTIELDRHRPARRAEVRAGLPRQVLRVLVAQGVVAALLVGLVWFFRSAAPWLAVHDFGDFNPVRDVLVSIVSVLRLLLEVLCWPMLGLAVLLLAPLLVIEEYSIIRSLREWLGMLGRHIGRIYLYEALAFALATALSLPVLLVVALAAFAVGDSITPVERVTLWILGGIALTPMIAYLTVANVFIYLNLRYEFFYSPPER
jgi:hypothetical protein